MKRICAVLHSCELLQQSVNIPQMNKHYTSSLIVLLSMEKLPIFKNCKFSKTFLPTSDSEFCAALGRIFDLVWFPSDRKAFWYHLTFSKGWTFSLGLCHVFFRVFSHRGISIQSVLRQDCWLGHPRNTPEERYELQWIVVMPVWCPVVKLLSLSFILSVW